MRNPPHRDGNEDYRRGRSNRRTGYDDTSMLGRGHGFGPEASRGPRRPPRRDEGPLNRNYARLADEHQNDRWRETRESRGPETSHYLEDDTYARGRVGRSGYGSRSRSMEATRRRRVDKSGAPVHDEFDDDLIR